MKTKELKIGDKVKLIPPSWDSSLEGQICSVIDIISKDHILNYTRQTLYILDIKKKDYDEQKVLWWENHIVLTDQLLEPGYIEILEPASPVNLTSNLYKDFFD